VSGGTEVDVFLSVILCEHFVQAMCVESKSHYGDSLDFPTSSISGLPRLPRRNAGAIARSGFAKMRTLTRRSAAGFFRSMRRRSPACAAIGGDAARSPGPGDRAGSVFAQYVRDSPRAFAADQAALAVARRMVSGGFDRLLRPIERCFVYLPFEHSEDLAAQRRSLALFEAAFFQRLHRNIDYAHRHYEIIARFGRFPHRNAVLGRASTPEKSSSCASRARILKRG